MLTMRMIMKNHKSGKLKLMLFLFLIMVSGKIKSQDLTKINWPVFMAQHDLVWEEIPLQWNEGAFTGNGQVGMMIYATMSQNRIDFHMGRQDM